MVYFFVILFWFVFVPGFVFVFVIFFVCLFLFSYLFLFVFAFLHFCFYFLLFCFSLFVVHIYFFSTVHAAWFRISENCSLRVRSKSSLFSCVLFRTFPEHDLILGFFFFFFFFNIFFHISTKLTPLLILALNRPIKLAWSLTYCILRGHNWMYSAYGRYGLYLGFKLSYL